MKRRLHKTRKTLVQEAIGGAQCRECRLIYCKQMRTCAYYEFLALSEDTTYECPDREEGNWLKRMDVE
jgi:hypothetical protein